MKNRFVAAGFAIVFGWIGFHKFYLWKWWQGLLYLIFSFSLIPMIIGFFEWILYLINKQDWFDATYNAEYMRNKDYINNKK